MCQCVNTVLQILGANRAHPSNFESNRAARIAEQTKPIQSRCLTTAKTGNLYGLNVMACYGINVMA